MVRLCVSGDDLMFIVGERQLQEILEKNAAVARLVLMFPPGSALIPVFKRFFQVELHGVDQLALSPFDHHLIAAEVGGGQQLKPCRNAVELQAVILPHTQHARLRRDLRRRFVNASEDWVVWFNNTDKAILIFQRPIFPLLVLLQTIERHDASAEAKPDKLMSTANCEHRHRAGTNELREGFKYGRVVVIEIA